MNDNRMRATLYCKQVAKEVIAECQNINDLNDYPWIESEPAAIYHGNNMWNAIKKGQVDYTKTQINQLERRYGRGVDAETIQLFFLAGIVQEYIDKQLENTSG